MGRNPEALDNNSILRNFPKISRRNFLGLGTAAFFGAAFSDPLPNRLIIPALEQLDAKIKSQVSKEQFLEENKKLLSQTSIGCSFSPEQFSYLYKTEDIDHKPKDKETIEALNIITRELRIKNIRLGIRWSHSIKGDKTDFSYYKPILDYCFKNNINLCLNVGPIKIFRWPEEHVPKKILEKIELPPNKSSIHPDTYLAQEGYKHLESLFSFLKKGYTKPELSNIKYFQPENEPYFPFGIFKWTSSDHHLREVIYQIYSHFPDANILVNSPGTLNFKEITSLFSGLKKEGIKGRLKLGIDYYHKIEDVSRTPIIGKIIDKIDPVFASKAVPELAGNFNLGASEVQKMGYDMEVTEAQVEPWGRHKEPGNSLYDFQYVLLRCLKDLLHPVQNPQQKSIIRIWGIERLVKRKIQKHLTEEQLDILDIISKINTL